MTYFFNPKLYPTNFMPFFFDNFCQLSGLGGGDKSSQSPVAPPLLYIPLLKTINGQKAISYCGAKLWSSLERGTKLAPSLQPSKNSYRRGQILFHLLRSPFKT